MKDSESNSNRKFQPTASKHIALLEVVLLSENWYGTPLFTENYQLAISDGYPEDFEPFELSKNKLNHRDYVLRSN
ncbi:MAG: hypothetical protein ACR2MX_00195 [Cyclobacteriaceae bacterium]